MLERKWKVMAALGTAVSLLVSGCSDDDDDEEVVKNVTVKVAKGAVIGAQCQIFTWSGTTALGSGQTGSDGTVTFSANFGASVPADETLRIVCTGGSYFDEASGQTLPVPTGTEIKAVVPSTPFAGGGTPSFAVTPLTSLAADELAEATPEGTTPTAGGALSANDEVAEFFGLDDILTPPTTIDSGTPSLGTDEADQYALVLASISVAAAEAAAEGETSDPFAFVTETVGEAIDEGGTAADAIQQTISDAVGTYAEELPPGSVDPGLVDEVESGVEEGDTEVDVDPTTGS